jgi:helicase required for RNAi-mediated heterochromatin assembly 1
MQQPLEESTNKVYQVGLDEDDTNDNAPDGHHRQPWHFPPNFTNRERLKASSPMARLQKYLDTNPRDETAGNWLSRPEIPSANEILDKDEPWETTAKNGTVSLHGIPEKGPFESIDVYLKTHYELLREDAVFPLREACAMIKECSVLPTENTGSKFQNVGIYSKVHIRGLTFARRGIAVEVSFSLRSCRSRIVWEMSNRLMSGCLVALSKDKFSKHCIVATIAARNLEKLNMSPPRIDLYFADSNALESDPRQEFVMIEERSGFFEAQRNSMLALQRLSKEDFPLSETIVNIKSQEQPPEYISNNPVIDATAVFGAGFENHNVLETPEPVETSLDETQLGALQHMLNTPLAIVQGPPGTGKTFVSVLNLKLLLKLIQADAEESPIIVACQTNHALDQLLRHVAPDIPAEFARLGGRSKDDGIVKERTMKALRMGLTKKEEKDPFNRLGRLKKEQDRLIDSFEEKLKLYTSGKPTLDEFASAGLLSPEQCQSIKAGSSMFAGQSRRTNPRKRLAARAATNSNTREDDALHRWLGAELEQASSLDADDRLGTDIIDDEDQWEFEVIKERQAEAGVGDEELDQLKGRYIALGMDWKGRGRHAVTAEEAKKLLSFNNLSDSVPACQRGPLFNHLLDQLKERTLRKFRDAAVHYDRFPKRFQQAMFERDLVILQQQKLIGMTTTGLSKFRALLDALAPKVVMIEEAAESLEAPLVSACVPSLQHLILVGDHQQLKPSVVVSAHAGKPWNFDLSLMERVLNNNLPYKTLGVQRRMAPEISANLFPIYEDKIRDHDNVKDRKPVNGMVDTSWIYAHEYPDTKDQFMSSQNPGEADMVAGFYLYLLQNEISKDKITILTFYKAQKKLLMQRIQKLCMEQRVASKSHP